MVGYFYYCCRTPRDPLISLEKRIEILEEQREI